jgi:hypothetical protein
VELVDDLPELPDSRPDTPDAERISRDKSLSSTRRNIQETPMKSPSHSAVPLKFIMGNRPIPSSPNAVRSSPLQSPATSSQDSLAFPRNRPRPTSWDSTKEYKPLYLVESNQRRSTVQQHEPEETLPALPPSQRSSRSSSQLEFGDDCAKGVNFELPPDAQVHFADPLSVDTALASEKSPVELLDSQQSTPKAGELSKNVEELSDYPQETIPDEKSPAEVLDFEQPTLKAGESSKNDEELSGHLQETYPDNLLDFPTLPSSRSSSPELEQQSRSLKETPEKAIAPAALVFSIGYFASSPSHRTTNESWLDDLPSRSSMQHDPSPVNPMTKDRSSYLLQSSPMSRKFEDDSNDRNIESLYLQKSDPYALDSIEERDGKDIFRQADSLPPNVEQDRERTLETLSGSTQEKLTEEESTRDSDDKGPDEQTFPEGEQVASTAEKDEAEPADEFFFTMSKSKRDKKKKGKGLLRSSTQDDISLSQASQETPLELSTAGDADPADEFSFTKSKGKKKDKMGKKPPSIWDAEGEETGSQALQEPLSERIQDTQEDSPTPAEVEQAEEFSLPKSTKDKRKDKKKRKSVTWEVEEDQAPLQTPLDSSPAIIREVVEEAPASGDVEVAGDFSRPQSKKGKKDKKSVLYWEPEGDEQTPQEILSEVSKDREALQLELTSPKEENVQVEVAQSDDRVPAEAPPVEKELPLTDSRESEVIHDIPQNISAFHDDSIVPNKAVEEEPTPAPISQEQEAVDNFVVPGSKKSKKKGKKGKTSLSWTPEADLVSERVPETADTLDYHADEEPLDEPDEFVLPGSKKGKKKSRKSQAFEPEPDTPSQDLPQGPDTDRSVETEVAESWNLKSSGDFTTPISKKGKKKFRKSQTWDVEDDQPADETTVERKVVDPEHALPTPGTPPKPIPIGGPGAWPVTPVSPWTNAAEEVSTSTSTDYFPSAAGLHSPSTRQSSDDTRSIGYFPSAAALLPIASAGAAALGADVVQKDAGRDQTVTTETTEARSLDSDQPLQPQAETDANRPTPDGLPAGYDNEQLNLAKQLQEEFGAGNKKTRKGKKRRSLPSTPDLGNARSRPISESEGVHPRARSLSIGPSGEAARSEGGLATEERKSVYSQDQLELARQLKAEFETGNKKSKKKPKRSSAQDDTTLDQQPEEQQPIPAEIAADESQPAHVYDVPKGDGFAAGYQEDQLSLARQLQAEFGSSLKKSKKDTKRRSTSQTPIREQEAHNDYFGEPSQVPALDSPQNESAIAIPESSGASDKEIARDGLAVGYSEDQVELARQLKEDFASGSKKSKKDKKDKKGKKGNNNRQSSLRSPVYGDFSSDTFAVDSALPQNDLPPPDVTEGVTDEPASPDPDEEFGFVTETFKKDGKAKTPESLLRTEDDFSSDNFGREVEALHNARSLASKGIEVELSQSILTRENELVLASTKDGGNRQSAAQEESLDQPDNEATCVPSTTSEKASTVNITAMRSAKDVPNEPIEDFVFQVKRSKDKKQKRSLQSPTFGDGPEQETKEEDVQPELSTREMGVEVPVAPLADEQDDGFEFTSRKSKKKKRPLEEAPKDLEESVTPLPESTEPQGVEMGMQDLDTSTIHPPPESLSRESALDAPVTQPIIKPVEETPEDLFENFAFTAKRSKKDRKKRKGKLDSEDDSGISTPLDPISEPTKNIVESSSQNAIVQDKTIDSEKPLGQEQPEPFMEETAKGPEEEWGSFSIKSKKKRKSRLSTPVEDSSVLLETLLAVDNPQESPTITEPLQQDLTDSAPRQTKEVIEDPTDEWGSFSTKKAKKKRQSGLSTPIGSLDSPETSIPSESILEKVTVSDDPLNRDSDDLQPVVSKEVKEDLGDDGGSFSTKKSNKNRKPKSCLSTPMEEDLIASEPEKRAPKGDFDEPNSQSLSTEPELPNIQRSENVLQPAGSLQNTPGDSFGVVRKRSKKDKKSQRASRLDSDSCLSTSTPPITTKVTEIDAERDSTLTSERFVASPVSFEDEKRLEATEHISEADITPDAHTADPVLAHIGESDALPSKISRKASKKDKRKRQATIDATNMDESSREEAPLTSWADEVEESEVERKVLVTPEIAKTESLSHIASTTEAASLPPEPAESFRPLIGEDSLNNMPEESYTNISSLATTGAALAGAALLGDKIGEALKQHHDELRREEPFTEENVPSGGEQLKPVANQATDEEAAAFQKATTLLTSTNEVDTLSSAIKVSKKEKRKTSVDRRSAPRDDIFDDPSLWEGAEPKTFEESRDGNEDGSDGFWSAPHDDAEPDRETSSHEEHIESHQETILSDMHPTQQRQAYTRVSRPLSPSAATPPVHELEEQQTRSAATYMFGSQMKGGPSVISEDYPPATSDTPPLPLTDLIRPEQQWNDLPDEFITFSSKEDKENKRQSRLAAWDNPQETEQRIDIETPISQPHMLAPPECSVEPPLSSNSVAFEAEPSIMDRISTPPQVSIEEQHFDKVVSFEEAPVEHDSIIPLSNSRYSRQSLVGLPVLREESPAEIELERIATRPVHVHDKDEIDRDSAFVTESPIPRQSGFPDDHEHIRDSGVHLRDFSPAENARAPAKTTDDALARLSWPAVDEETETVDLNRSQRAQIETVVSQHHNKYRRSLEFDESRPEAEATTEAHRPQRSVQERSDRHPDEHRGAAESHDLQLREEKSTDFYQSQRSTNDEVIKSRDLLPSQRIKEERHTDLHRTQTIHRSGRPKGDSLVKQRVERIESPDFSHSQRPKDGKYEGLHTSERPKAEKPRGTSDSHVATGGAIASATMGFAAARQASYEKRPGSAQSQRSASNINRLRTPDPKHRPESANSNRSSGTPPLRRSDRKLSGDLRSLSQRSKSDLAKEVELAAITASTLNTANPTANEGRVRAKDMADVYVS